MTPTRALFFRSLTLGAAIGLAGAALPGQDITRVLPAANRTVEGNSQTALPFNTAGPMRIQFAYGGSTAGFARAVTITALRFRANGGPASMTQNITSFGLELSTGRRPATALSSVFDDNHGADRTVVRDPATKIFAPSTTNATPNPFVREIELDRPFEWDPRSGPLLVDWQFGPVLGSNPTWDAVNGSGAEVGYVADLTSATASTATYLGGATQNLGLVMEIVEQSVQTPIVTSPNNSTTYPWGSPNPMRVQCAYGADEIPFQGRHRISALRWQVDPATVFGGATYDVSINMMTMPFPASAMQTTFVANFGADRTTVFHGIHVAPAGDHLLIPLSTPFEYDPQNGTLVVDIALRAATFSSPWQTFEGVFLTDNAWRAYHNADPYAATTSAPVQQYGLLMDMVAEPAPTVPQASDLTFGTHSVYPFHHGTPHRVMQLYKGSTFEGGTDELPLFIQHLRWRPTQLAGSFGPATFTCTIDLALRNRNNAALSAVFDSNGLIRKVRVFDGTFSVPHVPDTSDPDLFPIAVRLDTPYQFLPRITYQAPWGNYTEHYDLVVDIRMLSVTGATSSCDGMRNTVDVWRQVNYSDPNATTANYPAGGAPDHFALAMRVSGDDPNATSLNYGTACAGSNGAPRCATANLPVLPNPDFTLKLVNGPSNAFALVLLGITQTNVPLAAFGLPGCTQLCGAELGALGTTTNGAGIATRSIALPGLPAASGFQFTTQWAAIDAAANAGGVVFSDAQRHTARF